MKRLLTVTAVAFAAVLATATPALADHNSNNRATFTGAASGTAVVSYSEGQGTFNATISARDLDPGTYTYTVNGPAGVQTICTFTVGRSGNGGCGDTDRSLGGFTTAEIRDEDGAVVDSDLFTRQGRSECRDPNQAGPESAQCPNRTAP
jgi:hypothetical protein